MKLQLLPCCLTLMLLGTTTNALSDEKACRSFSLGKPFALEWKSLDVNQINCAVTFDGPYADWRLTGKGGLEWPKGSGKTAMFSAGIWLIGVHAPSDSLRTAHMDYGSEYQPGPLLEQFNTSTNDDAGPAARASDPRYRLYKISRGDTLSTDYLEWPGDLGAPYEDLDGNGAWDPLIDRPRFYGDQQIWCVLNDVNNARHGTIGLTPPMGVELQILYYAFDRPGPLENTMFIRWTFINKSDADYDSVYVALACDPDIGTSFDDFPGCDTTLNMAYVYNADGSDEYYGSTPPAMGLVYLQGPVVPGLPTDTARVGDRLRPGFKNLGMTSFVTTACVTYPPLECPPTGTPAYKRIVYAYVRGLLSNETYLRRPDSSIITCFFSGDPVAGTGDLPANFPLGEWTPKDLYFQGPSSGPFSLAPGDTQEVVAGLVIAQGSDRLESVTLLKRDAAYVRDFFAVPGGMLPQRYLSVQPSAIEYDSTIVGEQGETHHVSIYNAGLDTIHVSSVQMQSAGDFVISGPTPPIALATGESALYGVTFSPQVRGVLSDSLVVESDDWSSPTRPVALRGTAYTMMPAGGGLVYATSHLLYAVDLGSPSPMVIGPVFGGPRGLTVQPTTGFLVGVGDYAPSTTSLLQICSENADVVRVCTIPLENLQAIAFDGRGALFAGTGDGRLYRVDIATGDTAQVGSSSGERYAAFAFSPSGDRLWACTSRWIGGRADRILTVDTASGTATLVGYVGDSLQVRSLAFSPDGRLYGLQNLWGGEQRLVQIDTADAHGTVVGPLGSLLALQAIAMRMDLAVGVEQGGGRVPTDYALRQNYPNPFNPSTTIEFALPTASNVAVKIYNLLGEEIATLVSGNFAAGTYQITWDGSQMPSGVYFCRLTAGEYVQTMKAVLMK